MKFDAYEYIGVILPGSVVVLAATLLFPEVKEVLGKEGVSLGGLGVFVIASFVVGQVVQGLGNIIESVGSGVYGTGRSDRLLSPGQTLIAEAQQQRLAAALWERAGVKLDGLESGPWAAVRREMYSAVRAVKATDRIDAFNRTYGFMRGVTAGFLMAAVMTFVVAPQRWPVGLALLIGATVALFRMARFSDHYLRELVVEYLRLHSVPGSDPLTR